MRRFIFVMGVLLALCLAGTASAADWKTGPAAADSDCRTSMRGGQKCFNLNSTTTSSSVDLLQCEGWTFTMHTGTTADLYSCTDATCANSTKVGSVSVSSPFLASTAPESIVRVEAIVPSGATLFELKCGKG